MPVKTNKNKGWDSSCPVTPIRRSVDLVWPGLQTSARCCWNDMAGKGGREENKEDGRRMKEGEKSDGKDEMRQKRDLSLIHI